MDDVKFNEALASKRHKEIMVLLDQMTKVSKVMQNDHVSKLGEDIKNSIEKLGESLKNDEFLVYLKKLSTAWAQVVKNMDNKESKEWNFDITRNEDGFIKSVKATKL